jgi:hypothetical protein
MSVVGCLGFFLCASPIRAQTFIEFGGGWNYIAHAPGLDAYTHGFNLRASYGWKLSPRLRFRIDGFTSQFGDSLRIISPEGLADARIATTNVTGLTANWLLSLDPHGVVYVIAGAGFYDASGRSDVHQDGLNVGLSGGAGLTLPIGPRLRAFAEARDHLMLGQGSQPPWIAPITIGFRY